MTCHGITMTSQTSQFEFWGRHLKEKQSYSWQWRHRKIYEFVPRNMLNQNKHTKVKDFSSSYKRRWKTEKKKTEQTQKIVKIPFWVDGCYGNVNHHRHVIDTGKFFSAVNFRRSQEIWWLFVQPFKSYNSLKSARAECAPLPPRLNEVKRGSSFCSLAYGMARPFLQNEDPSISCLLASDKVFMQISGFTSV